MFCGVSWEEMDEKLCTTNYIHRRNVRKQHCIVMHRYNLHQPKQEDVYFFAGNGDKYFLITCEFVESKELKDQNWAIRELNTNDETSPGTQLLRAMSIEYLEEAVLGPKGRVPNKNKQEGPGGNGKKIYT